MIEFNNPTFIWCIIGIVMMMIEFMLPGFVIFFFGLGALMVSLITYLYPEVTLNSQLVIFLLVSILMLVVLRGWFKSIFSGLFDRKKEMPKNIDSFVGETAVVIKKISPTSPGKIEFHGTPWNATSDLEIPVDTTVSITKQNNLTLEVKPNTKRKNKS